MHADRLNGKDRYFDFSELEKVKFTTPLPISEAAERLGISETTLRRLEEQGMISPERNSQGERLYTHECLKNFLDSDYYIRQREIENKILEPEEGEESEDDRKERLSTQSKIINARLEDHHKKIKHLIIIRNVFYTTGLFFSTILILSVMVLAVLFLLYPQSMANWLGYRSSYTVGATKATEIQGDTLVSEQGKVLGASYNPNDKIVSPSLWAKIFKPASLISLGIVKKVNADTYYQVIPRTMIDDVNDVLAINSENEVSTRYNFTFPDTSYLHIPDQKLITNLNADFLRDKVPGSSPGDLAILGANNFIEDLKIDESNLTGQITEENKVAGSAVELSLTGGLMNNKGLSLTTKCDAGELLTWNGSAWVCTADISGNAENVNGIVEIGHGGTGQTSFSNGQLLIGNTSEGLTKSTLTAGANIVITNGNGSITIASTAQASTGANVGTAGVGPYRDNTGAVLNFKNINVASNKLSVADDVANSEVDLDVIEANITHNNLGGLAVGDPHNQYVFLNGRAGGQIIIGGTGVGENLTLQTTSNAVKGSYILSDLATGLVKSTAGTLSVITDNSTNWDVAFTWRLTSAAGTAPLTLTLAANVLTGSISDAAADGATKGISTFTTNDFDALAGVISIDYTNGQAASALAKGFLTAGDWTTFNNKQGTLTFGNLTAASTKISIGGTGVGALIGVGASVDVTEANITHNNLAGLTIGDPHTQYALLLGRSGGQSLNGGIDANDDLTLQGTTHATKTTSYVNLQPNGGNVGIGTATPRTKLELGTDGAILAIGTYGSGWTEPNIGAGTRLLWYPRKAAFRAGQVIGTEWDTANIGNYSVAIGYRNQANGLGAIAMGEYNTASNEAAVALGYNNTASGGYAFAMGNDNNPSGSASIAMGQSNYASGNNSLVVGYANNSTGTTSITLGQWLRAMADNNIVFGMGVSGGVTLINSTSQSLMVGFNSNIPTLFVGPSAGAGTTGNVGIGTALPGEKLEVNGGIRLNTSTAKPACDATHRGTFWSVKGGAGVQDTVEVCAKDVVDAYGWRTIY